jgi:uncharacterized protein
MISERAVSISVGPGPDLEGALAEPPNCRLGVALCHPHPLYGGDMDNPVVGAAARACAVAGLATLRFNFRGVGGSAGAWDEGRGEQDDVRAALACLHARTPRVALAGYSFGAAMAAAVAAAGEPLAGLALLAPPLATRPWAPSESLAVAGPVLLVAGSADDYCPVSALEDLGRSLPGSSVSVIPGADHFFLRGMDRLAAVVAEWAGTLS